MTNKNNVLDQFDKYNIFKEFKREIGYVPEECDSKILKAYLLGIEVGEKQSENKLKKRD